MSIMRITVDSDGDQSVGTDLGSTDLGERTLSSDGRYVVFESNANDLVGDDANGKTDVFLRDTLLGTTTLVSATASGISGDGKSYNASVSADGRYVIFESTADNLVGEDTNGQPDIFVRDTLLGTTSRISADGNNTQLQYPSYFPTISSDGRFAFFGSAGSGFLRDLSTGSTTQISNLDSGQIAPDGDHILVAVEGSTSSSVNLRSASGGSLIDIPVGDLPTTGGDIAVAGTAPSQLSFIISGGQSNRLDSDITINGTIYSLFQVAQFSADDGRISFVLDDAATSTKPFISFDARAVSSGHFEAGTLTYYDASGAIASQSPISFSMVPLGGGYDVSKAALSSDGRYVAFQSTASNLTPGDSNRLGDIFIRDTQAETTTLVSATADGSSANGVSSNPAISADGRYVVFESSADNLIAGDNNHARDVFVRDTVAGTTALVSTGELGQSDADSFAATISADGHKISFYSNASNLVQGDTNNAVDTFVADNPLWASPSAPTIHSNGGGVSASVDIAENSTAVSQIAAIDPTNEALIYSIVPVASGGGSDAVKFVINSQTGALSFSTAPDFENSTDSNSDNIYDVTVKATDTHGESDLQNLSVRVQDIDETLGAAQNISASSSGLGGNDMSMSFSQGAALSADGRYSVFWSNASNLAPQDTNHTADIFLHDAITGSTTLISKSSAGSQGDDNSYAPSISADGRYVVFQSDADNLVAGDTNGASDIFVRDLQTGVTTLVSVTGVGGMANGDSLAPSISADGRYVAFESAADNLVSGDVNGAVDIFVRDLETGTTTLVSSTSVSQGNGASIAPVISADGKSVVFQSAATNLVMDDLDGKPDLFIKSLSTGAISLIQGAGFASNDTIVDIGQTPYSNQIGGFHIANTGSERLSSDLTINSTVISSFQIAQYEASDHRIQVLVDDAATQTKPILQLTLSSYGDGGYTGELQTFDNSAGTETSQIVFASVTSGGGSLSASLALSSDARYIAFQSSDSSLVAGDTNGVSDIFLRDTQSGVTTLVSQGTSGEGSKGSFSPSISDDGHYVVFESDADNLVANDANGVRDVFVKNVATGAIAIVSAGNLGQANGASFGAEISPDGQTIIFTTSATNLLTGDNNNAPDVLSVKNPLFAPANTPPTIVSNSGGATASISRPENSTAVTTVKATDPDAGQSISYSIAGGPDAALFSINAVTGALAFIDAPNFEAPADAGANNVYDVTVAANDGHGGQATQQIFVAVTNVNEAATITGNGQGSVTEDGNLTAAGSLTVVDPDSGQSKFQAPSSLAATYGNFTFNETTGAWSYALNNSSPVVQALNTSDTRIDKLVVSSLDGTESSTITVTVHGADEVINPASNQLSVKGTAGNDIITIGASNLIVDAQAGDDIIKLKVGGVFQAHAIDGGAGNDTFDLSATTSAVAVDLGLGLATGTQIGIVALSSIENVIGGTAADTLTGNSGANKLDGGAGNDKLAGGAGDDILIGGSGNDNLSGGAGSDTFVFKSNFGKDTVTDFSVGTSSNHDTLDLSGLAFASVADVLAHTDSGASAVIHAGVDTITLAGVTKAQLQSHSFDILV